MILFWYNIQQTIPKIYLANNNLDVSITLISVIIFLGIRVATEKYFELVLNWDPDSYRKMMISSSFVSVIHALILVPSLGEVLWNQPFRLTLPSTYITKMKDFPKIWQGTADALLQLCTGYMINDIIGLLMTSRWRYNFDDIPFMMHHIGTIVYMTLARHLGAGHLSAMSLMFTGEITNPFQNIHTMTKFWILQDHSNQLLRVIHIYIEFLYAATYSFVRLVIGPIQILYITYALIFTRQGRLNIPLWVSLVWILIIWALIIGSLPWSFEALFMAMDGWKLKYDENFNYCTNDENCRYAS